MDQMLHFNALINALIRQLHYQPILMKFFRGVGVVKEQLMTLAAIRIMMQIQIHGGDLDPGIFKMTFYLVLRFL